MSISAFVLAAFVLSAFSGKDSTPTKLPKVVDETVSDDQINKMADATLKNDRPLENAFGKNWREIFTKDKVIELIRKM